MKHRALIIGNEPSDFCNDIAKQLNAENIVADLWEFREILPEKKKKLHLFYNTIKTGSSLLNINNYTTFTKLVQLFKLIFWKQLLSTKSIKQALRYSLIQKKLISEFSKYNIINFQFINSTVLLLSEFIPKETKIIFSFWGSDLYASDKKLQTLQNEKIKRCNLITLHSDEMEKHLKNTLSNSKNITIHQRLFGVNDLYIDQTEKAIENFNKHTCLSNYSIENEKIIITIGYCGNKVSNHIAVINSLSKLPELIKNKIHIVLPMTYGGSDAYINEVCLLLSTNNLTFNCIRNFLPIKELINIRLMSDIYIHANITDAFSSSMLEYLLSNNICLIGDWLPYSRLKKNNIFHISLSNCKEITGIIEDSINKLSEQKTKSLKNSPLIKSNFSQKYWTGSWLESYKSLL